MTSTRVRHSAETTRFQPWSPAARLSPHALTHLHLRAPPSTTLRPPRACPLDRGCAAPPHPRGAGQQERLGLAVHKRHASVRRRHASATPSARRSGTACLLSASRAAPCAPCCAGGGPGGCAHAAGGTGGVNHSLRRAAACCPSPCGVLRPGKGMSALVESRDSRAAAGAPSGAQFCAQEALGS